LAKSLYVYILASQTRRLYVGVTNDLVRRVWEHKEGVIAGFTKRYGINHLVYYEAITGPQVAIAREKQIKDYARVKKLALIASVNPEWHDLAESWRTNGKRADFSLRSK
jgi:putative endonuclease